MPYEGALRHQGIVARKNMIHFIQVFERLSYQEKLDFTLCSYKGRISRDVPEDKIQFNVRNP